MLVLKTYVNLDMLILVCIFFLLRREESLPIFKRRLLGNLLEFSAQELQVQVDVPSLTKYTRQPILLVYFVVATFYLLFHINLFGLFTPSLCKVIANLGNKSS